MDGFNKKTVTDEDVAEQIGIMEKKAEKIIGDKSRFDRFLTRAAKFVRMAGKIPVIGDVADDCATMIELLRDWGEKRYTALPIRSITLSVAALAYLLSPLDIIPDSLPIIGYVDDVSVIMGVLKLGIGADLDRYREWQRKNEKRLRRERLDAEIERLNSLVGDEILVACFITDERKLVISVTDSDDGVTPIVSRLVTAELPEWSWRMDITEIAEFYDEAILDHSFRRSSLGRVPVTRGDGTAPQPPKATETEETVEIEDDAYRGTVIVDSEAEN